MERRFFFDATRYAIVNLEQIMDESSSALIAMKHLRADIKGFLSEAQGVDSSMLKARYENGTGVRWSNFKKVFVSETWESQLASYTWGLLNALCAVFEGWIAEVLKPLPSILDARSIEKDLQFPKKAIDVIRELQDWMPSKVMEESFYSIYRMHSKYAFEHVDKLLLCYRVFKEIRNCGMHNGRKAKEETVRIYNQFKTECTKDALGEKEVPAVNSMEVGKIIVPNYRGVIGLSHIIIKLIVTYDVEFIKTVLAQDEFIRCYQMCRKSKNIMSRKLGQEKMQFCGVVKSAGYEEPSQWKELKKFLEAKGLVLL